MSVLSLRQTRRTIPQNSKQNLHNLSRKAISLVLGILAVAGVKSSFAADKAVQSDQFVDTVGINIHLHYTDTPYYSQYPTIVSSLSQLGIRHIRDGAINTTLQAYYDRHNQLGSMGIRGMYVTSPTMTSTVLAQWPAKVPTIFWAYENANEYDASSDTNWAATLKTSIPTLYSVAKNSLSPAVPVIGPSLVKVPSYTTLGNIGSYVDYGNMHNYFGGHNPGNPGWWGAGYSNYGSIAFAIQLSGLIAPNRPTLTSETGYTNDLKIAGSVPEDVSAVYMPRIFLEQYRAGVKRTYLYELLSVGGEDFGLLRKDATVKPAFGALANLLNMLKDPGAAFEPSNLDFTLTGGDANVHRLLFQKRDGTFYLALWVESQGYNPDSKVYTPVSSQRVTLYVPHTLTEVATTQWASDGTVSTQALGVSQSQTLTVTDKLQIVKIKLADFSELKTSASPAIGGSVSVSPVAADGIYDQNQYVTLTAAPASGYSFTGFTGSTNQTASPASMALTGKNAVVANFACTYALSSSTLPATNASGTATVSVTTGSGCPVAPQSDSSWVTATASSASGSGNISIAYSANTGAARTAAITVGGATLLVNQTSGVTTNLTFKTSPAGGVVIVDGQTYTTPYVMSALVGSTHVISTPTLQVYGGYNYLLYGWSGTTDGVSANASHTISVTTTPVTYTVNMVQGQLLTTNVVGQGTLRLDPDPTPTMGYYKPTQKVNIYATPSTGCTFAGFTGNTTPINGTVASVLMSQPATITATFQCSN